MAEFTARFRSGTCPGCGDPIEKGDVVEYLPKNFPYEYMTYSTKTLLWHSRCGSQALRDALCPACWMICGPRPGACLL